MFATNSRTNFKALKKKIQEKFLEKLYNWKKVGGKLKKKCGKCISKVEHRKAIDTLEPTLQTPHIKNQKKKKK